MPLTPDGVFEDRATDAAAADPTTGSPPPVGAEVCNVENKNKDNSDAMITRLRDMRGCPSMETPTR